MRFARPLKHIRMYALNPKPFTSQAPKSVASRSRRAVPCKAHKGPVEAPHVVETVAAAGIVSLVAPVAAQAAEVANIADGSGSLTFAVGSGAAIAGLGALLIATDPQKR